MKILICGIQKYIAASNRRTGKGEIEVGIFLRAQGPQHFIMVDLPKYAQSLAESNPAAIAIPYKMGYPETTVAKI
jgi:hypothetical protein